MMISRSDEKLVCYRFKICQSVTALALAAILHTHITIHRSMSHLFRLKRRLRSAPCTHSWTLWAFSRSTSSSSSKTRRRLPIQQVLTFISSPQWEPNNLLSWSDVCAISRRPQRLRRVAAVRSRWLTQPSTDQQVSSWAEQHSHPRSSVAIGLQPSVPPSRSPLKRNRIAATPTRNRTGAA